MQLSKLLSLSLFTAAVVSQEIDNDEIPNQCRDVCAPVVALSRTCDILFDTDDDTPNDDEEDRKYRNCVCSADGASDRLPLCESCVSQFSTDTDDDDDVRELNRACSFSSTSFDPSSTYDSVAITPAASILDAAGTSIDGVANTITSGAGGVINTVTDAAGDAASRVTEAGGAIETALTGNHGAKIGSGYGAGAAFALGVVAML